MMSGEDLIEWPEESRVIERTQSGYEGDERSVAGQAVQKRFGFQKGGENPKGCSVI